MHLYKSKSKLRSSEARYSVSTYAPPVDISRARHHIVILFGLLGDEIRNELGVVREVGIQDKHKVAFHLLQTVNVRGSKARLWRPGQNRNTTGIHFLQLLSNLKSAIRAAVFDNYKFIVSGAAQARAVDNIATAAQSKRTCQKTPC